MSLERWSYLDFTEDERRIRLKEHDRTEVSIKNDVISILNWLEKQPHLPSDILGEFFLS